MEPKVMDCRAGKPLDLAAGRRSPQTESRAKPESIALPARRVVRSTTWATLLGVLGMACLVGAWSQPEGVARSGLTGLAVVALALATGGPSELRVLRAQAPARMPARRSRSESA